MLVLMAAGSMLAGSVTFRNDRSKQLTVITETKSISHEFEPEDQDIKIADTDKQVVQPGKSIILQFEKNSKMTLTDTTLRITNWRR